MEENLKENGWRKNNNTLSVAVGRRKTIVDAIMKYNEGNLVCS